jgi:hypothetical protein
MKLPTSDKTSSFGRKPYIKKGYYPGKLLKVEIFSEKDGKPKVGKYGQQLIFEFAVYKKNPETDAPISPMMYKANEEDEEMRPVIISKFVYYMYKKFDKDKKWIEGEFQTAITPNSAITKILKALGWTFSTEDVDPEEFIGNWVELNIDDYEQKDEDESYTASTIKDINLYGGPEIDKDSIEDVKPTEKPKKVEKKVKHEAVKKLPTSESDLPKDTDGIKNLENKIEELKKLNKDGFLTKEGLDQAVEQIQAQIEELKKR